jgi:spermidine/putrescine ABC transporter ATP-binding subunit
VSLEIKNGEFMTLLGPSGCGKTTLLRIIAGFVQPDEGDVLLDGNDIKHLRPNKRPTGMVFQSYALFPHMNVKENIAFGLRMHKFEKGDMKKRIDQVMELAGIVELKERFPSQLSGGQQQRVALARTLALQPKVLLLDEPLAALDRKLRTEMRGEVRRIVDKVGITTIFVTHDQEEALTMSDRIAVMNKGVIIQCGTPMEIYDTPQTAFVASFIGDSNLYHGVVKKEASGYILESPQIRFPVPEELVGDFSGETIVLLRPEHLNIALAQENSENNNGMRGVITYVTHLGESIKYDVLLERGASINVQVHRSRAQMPFPQGATVVVSPINSDSFLFVRER